MKKIDLTRITKLTSSLRLRGRNPNLAWQILLGIATILAIALGAFAVLAYDWASNPEDAVIKAGARSSVVSVEEIRAAIELYKIKQTRYQELLSHRPETPFLGKGSSGVAPITPAIEPVSPGTTTSSVIKTQ